MKKTTKFFGLMLIALMMVPISRVSAQRHHRPGPPRGLPDSAQVVKMVDHLAIDLSLSEAQKEKITKLQLAHFAKIKENMEKQKSEREQNREEMKDLHEQILQVLNDEQKEKFKELQSERRDRRPGERPDDFPDEK